MPILLIMSASYQPVFNLGSQVSLSFNIFKFSSGTDSIASPLVTPLTRYSCKTWPGLIVNAHQHNLLTLNFSKTSISLPTSDETVTIID